MVRTRKGANGQPGKINHLPKKFDALAGLPTSEAEDLMPILKLEIASLVPYGMRNKRTEAKKEPANCSILSNARTKV